jgi:hypothetical protein
MNYKENVRSEKIVSEIRNIYLNENGEIILGKDILKTLRLQDSKVVCIVDSDQIILRNPTSITERLFGCCGVSSKEEYDFHIEIERFGGPIDEGK